MNKIFLLFYTFLTLSTFGQKRGEGEILKDNDIEKDGSIYDSSFALIIGQSDYTNGWGPLSGVKKDLPEVERALKSKGFHVESKLNLPYSEFGSTIKSFLAQYAQNEKNRIIIYYAGHGHTVKNKYKSNAYILPVDCPKYETDNKGFIEKAYPLQTFNNLSDEVDAKHILYVFDACFAGDLFKLRGAPPSNTIRYLTSKAVRHFITSGSENETVPDVSIFREYFVRALETYEADYNKDNYVTGSELGDYLTYSVVEASENRQHPQSGKILDPTFNAGEFVIHIPLDSSRNEQNIQRTVPKEKTSNFISWGNFEGKKEKGLRRPGVRVHFKELIDKEISGQIIWTKTSCECDLRFLEKKGNTYVFSQETPSRHLNCDYTNNISIEQKGNILYMIYHGDLSDLILELKPIQGSSDITESYIDQEGKFKYVNECYLLFTGSRDSLEECKQYIKSQKEQGFTDQGYLWIPDYPSLSGKPFFATFSGPYFTEKACLKYLKSYEGQDYDKSLGESNPCYCKKISMKSGSKNPEDDEIKLD